MYYWFFGTNSAYQRGGSEWKRWNTALQKAALDTQRRSGEGSGSWDPSGPWGYAGGRVYSTSVMALTLQAPYRLARLSELD